MDTWLSFFRGASEAQILDNPAALAAMFSLDVDAPQVAAIQGNLSQTSPGEIQRAIDNVNIMNGEWPGLVSLCKAYLQWCALIDPENLGNCFESYAKVFLAVQQAFTNFRGSCLNLVIKNVVTSIERIFMHHGKLYVEWMAAGILKLFNSVRSEREVPAFGISKKDNILFYANMISRVYFKSEQFVSAGNVFKNMYSLEVKFSQFSLREQVEFRYWLGRYCLHVNQLELAYTHLYWAWSRCLPHQPQYVLILHWLVVPSVLVGRIPSSELLSLLPPEAQEAVTAISHAIRLGEYPPNFPQLVQNNSWILSHHLRPLLENHLPLLVYRKGIHRLIKLSGLERLPLQLCRIAYHMSASEDPDLVLTEGICIALITNGFLKGNILPRSGLVALKSKGSIPALVKYYNLRLPERESWILT